MRMRVFVLLIVGACLLQAPGIVLAQFPAAGTDNTTSLGQFTIIVNPAYQPALTGAPGYDGSGRLTSPLLFDQNTQIDRSNPKALGASGAFNGVTVGSGSGTITLSGSGGTFFNVFAGSQSIPNSNYAVPPPGFVVPPVGTDSVITNIHSFDLAAGGVSVTAGTAAVGLPPSLGQVTSISGTSSGSGTSANDFPARSFFDVFVDVTIPGLGSGGTAQVFTNSGTGSEALIISNSSISSFPPVVIYTHGNSSAVPILFATDDTALGAHAGDIFGILTLAGHGVGYTNSDGTSGTASNGPSAFESQYQQMTPMPALPQYGNLPPTASWAPNVTIVTPEPGTVSLLAAFAGGAAAIAYRRRRRRRTP